MEDNEQTGIQKWWQRIGCMRNPGAHTGEEAARDCEIADLRTELANVKAALATAEKMLGEANTTIWPKRTVRVDFTHQSIGEDLFAPQIEQAMRELLDTGDIDRDEFTANNGVHITLTGLEMRNDPVRAAADAFKDAITTCTGAAQIGMDMASGPDYTVTIDLPSFVEARQEAEDKLRDAVDHLSPGPVKDVINEAIAQNLPELTEVDPLEGIVNGIHKHAQDILHDGLEFHPDDVHKIGQPGAVIRAIEKPQVERRKVIWPEPGKVPFDLERDYDPMNMKNREGPLRLREDDIPRRRRSDRESED